MSKYLRVTMNLQGAQTRRQMLAGKDYLVVPTVMLTQGVHNGSQGKLLYLPEEIGKTPGCWNLKPAMLYHPTLNGEGVSACSPDVLERQQLGLIMQTDYDGRLKNETWIDESSKAAKTTEGQQVINDIKAGKMVEVSTGLYHDPEDVPGVWNGEEYTGIVRNIRPDHLAILPGQKGACSIEDGAGLLRNADGEELSYDDIREQIRGCMKEPTSPFPCEAGDSGYCYVSDVFPKYAIVEKKNKVYKVAYKVRKGKVSISEGELEEVRKVTTYVTANGEIVTTRNEEQQGPLKVPAHPSADQLSAEAKKQQFQSTLQKKYSGIQQEGDWGGWTTELFANYAIFSKEGKHFRLPYTYDDDKINFDGDFEQVERVSEYRTKMDTPIDGTQSPSDHKGWPNTNTESTMPSQPVKPTVASNTKTVLLTAPLEKWNGPLGKLIANAIHEGAHAAFHEPDSAVSPHKDGANSDTQTRTLAGGARKGMVDSMVAGGHATEKDRSYLEGLPDDHFESVRQFAMKGAAMPIQPYTYDGIGDRSTVHAAASTQNQQTEEQWLATAPPRVRQLLQNAEAQERRERGQYISIITNKNASFNPKWLESQTTDMLRGMAALASGPPRTAPVANYGGQADTPSMFLDNVGTTDNAVEDEVLSLPSTNWSDEAAG